MRRAASFPIRWLGVIVGLLSLATAALMFVIESHPSFTHIATFVLMGAAFLFYGLTGRAGRPMSRKYGKERHLAVYDYGQGGVWMFFWAPSADAITQRYPELKIVKEPPDWMNHEKLKAVEARTYDIDETPNGSIDMLLKSGRADA